MIANEGIMSAATKVVKRQRWQKAQIIKDEAHPEFVGREVWIKARSPQTIEGWIPAYELSGSHKVFETNYRSGITDGLMWVLAANVELLPEFSDSVELRPWSDFV